MRKGPRRADEGIVNSWLFIRYLVIGIYVGLATVGGYIWWFMGYIKVDEITEVFYSYSLRLSPGNFLEIPFFFLLCQKRIYIQGPRLNWTQLVSFESCSEESASADGYSCSVFESRHPNTISMSVLVTVEMFNALNALSENQSLLTVSIIISHRW